ncbi:protoheme IX farnesyltransferase [Verrucomicrobia bacterium IMCC26134]|jgi:protoheme IX farnesyltransferase|nr:protoheme IX farnesyltransferase [Verrucomicrobia bacterium IMCC26134]
MKDLLTPSTQEALPPARFGDYMELTKPRLSFLSVVTTLVGYAAVKPGWHPAEFFYLCAGTCACAGGVAAVNQWMESDTDARMERTADRPIPTGKVAPGSAFILGWGLCAIGLGLLFAKVNGLATAFALATIVSYLALYTPAKRVSRWSTELGAVAGALPPLIGWAAGEGGVIRVGALGWILFGILLTWQIPHFMAVAWTYRHDYAAVNFPMLPVRDPDGAQVARWSLINTVALVVLCLLPYALGMTGLVYAIVTTVLGLWFLFRAIAFTRPSTRDTQARKLFLTSIGWLPLQLGMLVIDRLVLNG